MSPKSSEFIYFLSDQISLIIPDSNPISPIILAKPGYSAIIGYFYYAINRSHWSLILKAISRMALVEHNLVELVISLEKALGCDIPISPDVLLCESPTLRPLAVASGSENNILPSDPFSPFSPTGLLVPLKRQRFAPYFGDWRRLGPAPLYI